MKQSEYGPVSGDYELNMLRTLEEDMRDNLYAVIYHTDGCMKCKVTAHQLDMPCEMVLISRGDPESSEIIDYMDFHGWQSAPLVFIYRGDERVDEWHDMQPDKIKEWNGED